MCTISTPLADLHNYIALLLCTIYSVCECLYVETCPPGVSAFICFNRVWVFISAKMKRRSSVQKAKTYYIPTATSSLMRLNDAV